MNDPASEKEVKEKLRETFDDVAEGYDNPALRYFSESAKYIPEFMDLDGNENVLDVATGTGNAAIALAGALPGGHVTGIDFSEGMLARAKAKIRDRGLRNITLIPMDMQALYFPDCFFDAAVFSFSIFFVEDMEQLLCHILSKVKPGGKVIVTNFCEGTFSPLVDMFSERIGKYGVETPSALRRLSTPEECISLFENAGLADIRVDVKDLGYHLADAGQWWDVVWNAGLRRLLKELTPDDLEEFKKEHLKEIQELSTGEGIWLDVKVSYAIGKRPLCR
ncbi:methyltransferase domain-containing protein [bacterium]|nr:MAG: methyltransferase domain-containing protein [bacterium]